MWDFNSIDKSNVFLLKLAFLLQFFKNFLQIRKNKLLRYFFIIKLVMYHIFFNVLQLELSEIKA